MLLDLKDWQKGHWIKGFDTLRYSSGRGRCNILLPWNKVKQRIFFLCIILLISGVRLQLWFLNIKLLEDPQIPSHLPNFLYTMIIGVFRNLVVLNLLQILFKSINANEFLADKKRHPHPLISLKVKIDKTCPSFLDRISDVKNFLKVE